MFAVYTDGIKAIWVKLLVLQYESGPWCQTILIVSIYTEDK